MEKGKVAEQVAVEEASEPVSALQVMAWSAPVSEVTRRGGVVPVGGLATLVPFTHFGP